MVRARTEQRDSDRVRVAARVEVRLHSGVLVEGVVVDLSERGILMATERSLPLESRVRVLICPDKGGAADGVCLDGRVARMDIRGVAIAFAPVDSIERKRLRRIMDTDGESPPGGA
ncbi:MAG TPA: PilZ domain-containing protein [Candidatus Hydrogenedentes bacterium]|nr:PilZ domain-containing protein [Candidatus Hydrogenedentota bacterium]HOC71843.1 PilZ domain-containing protein [Candidatus Hydrogenedentota bacterium]HOH50245.1 PilZ domain-containing protein [Candidatus Hydrogenedentota bacterium]HQL94145.1 PilZ domain-containing protein [Candidatus Hydrogenedentota bacterium]HRZ81644.1 PilZ domain-containing protein [Candidatus Hydrogenedentota bacterium]